MDVMLLEEAPVTPAPVHDLMTEAALQEAGGLRDNARKPDYACQFFRLGGEFRSLGHRVGGDTLLMDEKVITASSGDEEDGVPIGFPCRDHVLCPVIEIDGTEAYGGQPRVLVRRKIAIQIAVTAAVEINGLVVKFAKLPGPEIGFHVFSIFRDKRQRQDKSQAAGIVTKFAWILCS